MNRIGVSLLLAATAPALGAAEATSARDLLLNCAEIRDGVPRLDCYDRAAAAQRAAGATSSSTAPAPAAPSSSAPSRADIPPAVRTTPAPAPAQPPAVTQAPAPATTTPGDSPAAASSFGEEQLRRGEQRKPEEPQSLSARITESRRGGSGIYFVTLDNGQVWRHEEGSMAEYLRPGEAVTIRPASLGSYRLTLDKGSAKNWVRVTRVR